MPETDLKVNTDRMLFMYMFLGGCYKGFGIDGDTLPEMCQHLLGEYSSGVRLVEDEGGQVCLALCSARWHIARGVMYIC